MKERFLKLVADKDFDELIKGGGVSFFFRFGGLALGYILTLVISNLFGAKGLGDYVLAITVLSFFHTISKGWIRYNIHSIHCFFCFTGKMDKYFSFQKKSNNNSIFHFFYVIVNYVLFSKSDCRFD
jgi:hypothetical protein